MGKLRPRYDVHFWNLDYLENVRLQPLGNLRPIFPHQPELADKVALLEMGEIATLLRRSNVLEIYRPDTHQRLEIYKFEEQDDLVDMVVAGSAIYFFEARRGAIIRLEVSEFKVVATTRWYLKEEDRSAFARLAVKLSKAGDAPEAYLAPTFAGGILAVELSDDLKTRNFSPPPGSIGLSKNVHLCIDSLADTLYVTDPDAQKITEINTVDGSSRPFWGPQSPVRLEILSEHFRAERSRPQAIAIYRTRQIIPANILKPSSRELLVSDPTGIFPRTLLIADTGNFCILKLVQLPSSARLLDLAGRSQLLAFLGSGRPPKAAGKNYNLTPLEGEDLRRYLLPPPQDISVSLFGEVLVRSAPEYPMLLLQPATSRAESLVRREARASKLDSSD